MKNVTQIDVFCGVKAIGRGADVDKWFWRAISANGKIIADSGESYTDRYNARRAALDFVDAMRRGVLVVIKDNLDVDPILIDPVPVQRDGEK